MVLSILLVSNALLYINIYYTYNFLACLWYTLCLMQCTFFFFNNYLPVWHQQWP